MSQTAPEKPMQTTRVLVVDDDKEIVRVVRSYLEHSGFDVFTAHDGNTALHIITRERPGVVILDWMLPDKDGLDVMRLVRQSPLTANIYIIMLTARIDDVDRVLGLEIGADDYVIKPFNPREVVARVRAGLRRRQLDEEANGSQLYYYGDLSVDLAKRHVVLGGKTVELTPTEFNLLAVLIRQPGVPFSRAELVQKRLGYDYESIERTLDSHVRNLRKKIEPDPANPTYVQTVYGVGYRLGEP